MGVPLLLMPSLLYFSARISGCDGGASGDGQGLEGAGLKQLHRSLEKPLKRSPGTRLLGTVVLTHAAHFGDSKRESQSTNASMDAFQRE